MTRVMVALWVAGTVVAALLFTAGVSAAQEGGGTAPATPSWESLSPGDLLWLARQIAGDDPDRKEARQLLAEHVTKTYLASPDATRSVSCWEWKGFAECFSQDLSAPIRTQWQEKILGAYAGSAEALGRLRTNEIYDISGAAVTLGVPFAARAALAGRIRGVFDAAKAGSMGFDDLKPICDALNVLGARSANEVLIAYTETSSEWRSFEPAKLADLAWGLDNLGETAAMAQVVVAKHVMATFLGNADAVRAIGLEAWGLLTQMGRNLPAESRQAWAKVVKEAFAPRESDLLQMEGRDVARLAWGLEVLDRAQAAALARVWLTKSDRMKTADKGDVIGLAYKAVSDGTASPAEREAIPNRMADLLLSQPEQMADFENCALMVSLWEEVGNRSKVQEWMTKAYQCALGSEGARARVSVRTLEQLADWYYRAAMTGPDKGYPGFAQALARHAREGTLVATEPETLSSMLGTPESRQVLRAELLDAGGTPRMGVAKVLSHAYRQAGELTSWREETGRKVSVAEGDTKASWLLVRAYAESVLSSPPAPLSGKEWLEQSLETAASEPVRLLALDALVRGYAFIAKYDEALGLLDSHRGQFQGAQAQEGMEVLISVVNEARARAESETQQAGLRAARLYEEELVRRLEAARARGDAGEVERYERLLGKKR